ncbi:hypothetical protein TNCT_598861 [Trichonephila clavata]|uniref:Uncharacterized protein n=1 Tax=Trichonephila clavata TaxID=2740835 RepID=A0A8X6GS88_TRICU|nr:hypothetical protein TNCT_598861 [Trichonephila clavata]
MVSPVPELWGFEILDPPPPEITPPRKMVPGPRNSAGGPKNDVDLDLSRRFWKFSFFLKNEISPKFFPKKLHQIVSPPLPVGKPHAAAGPGRRTSQRGLAPSLPIIGGGVCSSEARFRGLTGHQRSDIFDRSHKRHKHTV